MSGIGRPDDGPAKRPQSGFAARPGPRPGGPRPFISGAFPSTTTAKDVPTQNGVSGQPAQPPGQQPARPRGPGPSTGLRPMARPSSAGPANPSTGLTGRPQGGTTPAGPQAPPNLQRMPNPRPGGPVSRPTGPRGPLPGQQSQPAQANGLQFSQPGVFSGPARGPPSGGTPSQFQKPTPGGPQGFAPARPQNFGPPTQQRGSQPPISNNLPGPTTQPYNPFMRPGPGQPGPPLGGAPPGPMAPPTGPPVPSFGVSGPPMSNNPGTSQGPPAPFGPRPPSFRSANSAGMQGGGFPQQGGFNVQSSQKKLDPYESIPVNTGNAGQGMGPGNVQSPVEFQSLPRPLDEEDPAVRAPPLAHPRNCDSRYVRLTVSVIPKQQSMRSIYQMPIGAIVHPLADPQDIPIVSPDSPGIIRCRRCRTYINPFVVWQDGGRRFVCNVCAMTNDVPVEYYSALDHNGQRQDLDQRPELRGGSVEYIAPQEYMVRAPMPPVFFFVIDVSVTAINSGMVATACAAIKESLDRLPGGDRTRIGFLTFDSNLHFYNLKSSLSQPQMMVVTEIEEPFVPQPDDLIVNLVESREVVDALLTNLPQMFASSLSSEAATGPALKAAFLAMSSIGGKLLLFQAAVPSLGKDSAPLSPLLL